MIRPRARVREVSIDASGARARARRQASMPVVARAREEPSETVPQSLLVGDDVDGLLRRVLERACGDVERRRAYVHARAERSGKAPLHLAAWRGSLDVVRALAEDLEADIDQISTGRHNYGKTPIFYALTRCRDDVVMYLVERGAKVKIINNKGQSPYSLALSHCSSETIERIRQAEEKETTWWNFRLTHSDGLKYGDLDPRFFPEAASEPGRGVSTVESRRRNFKRLNKGVSWDNPDGIDLSSQRKAEARSKREREAEDAWAEFGEALERQSSDSTVNHKDIVDLLSRIVRAETAIAASGQKPDITNRAVDVFLRVAENDDDYRMLRALVGVRLSDSGITDRALARSEKAQRTACKILAAAVGESISKGAWSSVTPTMLFDFCGSALMYGTIRQSVQVRAQLSHEQLIRSISRACEDVNLRELNDIINLEEMDASSLSSPQAVEHVIKFTMKICETMDASNPSSVAHIAVNLADVGTRVASWRAPIFEGLNNAAPSLAAGILAKIGKRLIDTWQTDVTSVAGDESDIIASMEMALLDDLMDREEWLEAKAYASTREALREAFSLRAPTDIKRLSMNLESMSISSELPIMVPRKKIVLVEQVSELTHVRNVLSRCAAFAFDCEWRDPRPISTLQLSPAGATETYIVDALQIGRSAFADFLVAIFSDVSVKKFAFAAAQDWRRLIIASKTSPTSSSPLPVNYRDANVLDLQGETLVSLASIVADTLGFALDKRCQRSNWDARPLSQQQLFYAALDAEVLLDIATRRGELDDRTLAETSSHPDAHLYSSDATLFRDGIPSYGAELNATDASLFEADARSFGADLWESDRLLFTTPERMASDRKDASLRILERSAFVSEAALDGETCAVCLNEICARDKLIRTRCDHVYHAACLISALRSSPLRCPMCRASVETG